MNAILDVDCSKFSAWFTFTCPECQNQLEQNGDGTLEHPEFDGVALFGKGKRIVCSNVGKKFKEPVQTIKLEALLTRINTFFG